MSTKAAGALLCVLALSIPGLARPARQQPQQAAPAGDVLSVPGRASAAHRLLFTPRGASEGAYVVNVLPQPMEEARREVMRSLGVAPPEGDGETAPASGPWSVRRLEVGEAFGSSGSLHEPVRLARLFNGRRAQVSRGPVVRDGTVVASVTLISPYPDPSLTRLEPGTLVIVFLPGSAAPRPGL